MTKYDGIIVGAGIVGVSIAYHLSKLGYSKLLLIDKGGVASGITGICPGGIRQQWGTEINCRMAKAAVQFYENINTHLEPEETIGYSSVGYMYTFHSEEAIENYKKNKELQNKLGIPTEFLTPEQAAEIVPGIDQESFKLASYCKTDGFVDDAYHVTQGFADAAKRRGATVINDEVKKVLMEGQRVTGVQTKKRGEIHADFVVNAAGLGSKELAATAGINLPISFETRRILYTNRIEKRLIEPLLISFEKGFAAKQLSDGVLYMSYLGESEKKLSSFEFKMKAAEVGMEIFPPLEQVEFRTHTDGVYDSTPDHQAILGDVDGVEGYYQAVGMSGHGFMMAPIIGETLADLIDGKEPSIDIRSLHMNRFKEDKLLFEPSVV
ncbi:NAD(P)/FAD-dependent oxidoreductase [Halalkalibacillus halophilus]|uniref:NAD(P)/FAD-dependent oxidoreductase n=1 Tax=Halalkalibacillus halophilus TaxID=392827 RepID=UPI0003FB76D7|nr:FAD-binding oxidoreductase [Halalkalibacillus halophilus]